MVRPCARGWVGRAPQIFFVEHRIGLGVSVIACYFAALVSTVRIFVALHGRGIGLLMAPWCLFIMLAGALNFEIWRLNPFVPNRR